MVNLDVDNRWCHGLLSSWHHWFVRRSGPAISVLMKVEFRVVGFKINEIGTGLWWFFILYFSSCSFFVLLAVLSEDAFYTKILLCYFLAYRIVFVTGTRDHYGNA